MSAPERGLPAMTRAGEAWLLGRGQIASRHRAHAAQHLEAAAALEAFEFGECIGVPVAERGTCPLLHDVEKIESIPGGVRLLLVPGAVMEHVLAHIRCHNAFGRARAFADMPGCPLYIPDIDVHESDARAIEILGKDPAAIELLQRRALGHQTATGQAGSTVGEAE